MTVTWGKEHFAPVQYQSLEVGPFDATVTVQPGETAEDAYDRARAYLSKVARTEYEEKLEGFLQRVKHSSSQARKAK